MPTARELLGPDGALAAVLHGYEARPGQLDMATAVERALDQDRILLCEAGTGTGKTLAYLIPALQSGRKVVISTASRALQEQIFSNDLPLVRSALGIDVHAQVVKGLSNYLCRRRFAELRFTQDAAKPIIRTALPIVEQWAERTRQGDLAEVESLAEHHPIWREVASSQDTRIGSRCPEYEACYITQMKRRAEQAQLLIVNHHLLCADLAIRGDHPGGALPPHDAVIIDEAHRLEDVATGLFGVSLSSGRIERLCRDTARVMKIAAIAGDDEPRLVERVRKLGRQLLAAVNLVAKPGERQRMPHEAWHGGLLDDYHALDDALDALHGCARNSRNESLTQAATRVARLRSDLSQIVEPQRSMITWVARSEHGLTLSASHVDVGPMLRERLFDRGHAVVLTSASLSTGGGFAFVRSRLGLEQEMETPVDELVVQPAIDHRAQSLLYTPRDLPAVDDAAFGPRAAERIVELVDLTPGGAFVLCTSVRNMRILASALASSNHAPMVQGEAPKATLLQRFRDEGNGLLVATMSFWEGVDVPGDALRLVVIDRIPFAVPTDPLVVARCETLRRNGRSAFDGYTLPRAAITLKQGFGRLLRNRQDDGVVAILDRRITTRSYGESLLDSLPEVRRTTAVEDVAHFWQQRHARW